MQPYEMLWRTDENGVPTSVAIEEQIVVGENLYLTLEEIPDSYQRVTIATNTGRIYESMNRNQLTTNRFYVDYNNGIVYFDSSLLGKALTINYYGRGFKRISAKRIVGLEVNTPVAMANMDNSQERIAKLEKAVQHLQKQIDFLINELENRNY